MRKHNVEINLLGVQTASIVVNLLILFFGFLKLLELKILKVKYELEF